MSMISPTSAEDEVRRIMDAVDMDNNGKIDFNGKQKIQNQLRKILK